MLIIAANMPQWCALVGLVLAIVCSRLAGVTADTMLWRVPLCTFLFGLVGMGLGLLLAGALTGGRREERARPPAK